MNTLPAVIVRPGEADRIIAGHPWVYRGSILRLTQPARDGEVVQVKDHRQRFLGVGLYNSRSKINVRVMTNERVAIDQMFFERRLREAVEVRLRHMPRATSYRVVNSEGDLLSGLILDKYEDVAVLQISALGIEMRKQEVLGAVKNVLAPKAVIERSDIGARQFEGLPSSTGVVFGELESDLAVNLNGLRFSTHLLSGHKTGLYLDQQENYRRVAEILSRWQAPRVLDCFCFAGGFALHVARAGAASVQALDQNAEAVESAKRNAANNGVGEICSFEVANVFDWLKSETTTKIHEKLLPRFDAIILDPPSFTKNRASIPDALRGYKEIHLRALKLLKRGGMLATFCCSHHISSAVFQDVIMAAAFDARKLLRRNEIFSHGPDHPVLPAVPESEYLKGFAFELIR